MGEYHRLGISDVEIAELLKQHYDTDEYGLRYSLSSFGVAAYTLFNVLDSSVVTIRRLRKKWNMLSTRQQKHTEESIYEHVYDIRKRFPMRGSEGIRKTLRLEHGVHATRYEIATPAENNINVHSGKLLAVFSKSWNQKRWHSAVAVDFEGDISGLQA